MNTLATVGEMLNGESVAREVHAPGAYSRLTDEHIRQLLEERRLTRGTIEAAGLWSPSAGEVREIVKFNPTNSGAIAIPYLHPFTGEIRLVRVRPDIPPLIDGKLAKYLSPKGAGNFLYFPPGCGEKLKNPREILYLTEGEFKSLIAWQFGLLCIAVAGVSSWKGKGLDGQSKPIPDLDLIPWPGRCVVIVFDSDVTTNPEVQRARQALAKELYRRGATAVCAVNLPHGPNGAKRGYDDFLIADGLDAFLDLEPFELPATDLPPFLEPVSNLLSCPDEIIDWGIQGLQPIGASGWRIAGPKTGKSWDMLEEAYCLATQQAVFGHFTVPRKRRVIIIEEEDPKRRIQRRLRRIIHAHGGIVPSDEFFRYSVKKGVRLDDPKWQEVIEWEIRRFRPDIVYLDVFNRLHAKNINDAEEMSSIILFLDSLNHQYECAFVLLHHTRKNSAGGDDHDEIIGSRVLGGFAEATLFFSKTKEKGVLRVKVALKDEPEDGSFEPEFLVQLVDTLDQQGTCFQYLGAPAEKKVAQELREKIKTFVLHLSDFQTAAEIGKAVGCSKPTARDHLNALVDLKVVGRRKKGPAYVYGPPDIGAREKA